MRLLLLVCLSACSFFATEGPAPGTGPTKCNYHDTPILADAALTLGAALAAGIAAVEGGGRTDVIAPAAGATLFAVSTGYGAIQVHRCRAAHALRPQWSLADMPAVM